MCNDLSFFLFFFCLQNIWINNNFNLLKYIKIIKILILIYFNIQYKKKIKIPILIYF